ncbi:ABC transporter, ATP-binding protein [Candidatus Syntrophocurvum alkaliphilum]|uniref:ABC transporter, ATP-binding protein n=1 Tax=Candidatus Syntrophocurvum alkaliphilum TaxID=2293317 RepID=A0A6I6DH57_9FIRM|nr:ABC transporter ATP-binding protein [Candidatus Syntrophocurvum alkaliphilum]QGU00143.1 ABC transporter, ATP-binding protein [Candidatus Syntrophocurvum alkaliphilum]
MSENVLMHLDKVSKVYTMGEVKVEALKHTTLEVYQGEFLVILGPSGSGKSTLLNILGGMDQASSGEVYYKNRNLTQASEASLTRFRREEVGFVFQFYNLIPDLTAKENVEIAADLVDNPLLVNECLKDVELYDRMNHFPSQMSGGEQQRISIARALVKNPRLLLCDEPTGALDYSTGKTVLSLLKKINVEKGCTVIVITHNTAIGAMGDRVVRMRDGEIFEITINESPLSPERIEW